MKVVKLSSHSVDDYVAEEFLSHLLYVMCMYVSGCVSEGGPYLYVSLSKGQNDEHLRNSQCPLHWWLPPFL